MSIFVDNNVSTELMKFIFYLFTTLSGFWKLISYEFFTLDLEWLNNLLGFKEGDIFYFQDYSISILSIGTTALIIFLIIHFVILLKDFIFKD